MILYALGALWEHLRKKLTTLAPYVYSDTGVTPRESESELERKSEIPKIINNWDEKIEGDNSLQVGGF